MVGWRLLWCGSHGQEGSQGKCYGAWEISLCGASGDLLSMRKKVAVKGLGDGGVARCDK